MTEILLLTGGLWIILSFTGWGGDGNNYLNGCRRSYRGLLVLFTVGDEVMSEIYKERVYGNFKPSAKQKLKAKKAKKKDTRSGMSDEHCANIRQLACINCNWPQSEVHHLKCTGERGAGLRSTDKWGVPLCHDCHINGVEKVGSRNEIKWFQTRGIDCLALAAALWANRHDLSLMKKVRDTHFEAKAND